MARAALCKNVTMAKCCQALDLHASQVTYWKRPLFEGAADVFDSNAQAAPRWIWPG